jgi:uncharacterized protein (DUF4415 family)
MAKKKTFKTGKTDIPKDEFNLKKSKVRISLIIDGDVLEAYKEAARETQHGEYQTLMKEKIREAIFGKQIDSTLRETIREVVREELGKAS